MNVQQNDSRSAAVMHVKTQTGCTFESLAVAIESAAPPPKKMTVKDTLAALKNQLLAAKKRGHDAASLTSVLQAGGLKVSQRMVGDLLREVQPKVRVKVPS